MKWTANKAREVFLKFFEEKKHEIVPSSSLLPKGDPSLLFTNAGMNQFKPYFLGSAEPPWKRAASCQKCMRAGGKHNDLDNVGFTRRHHTFFEMLGNFSFGDYFKKDAIKWAYELITEVYGIEKGRLWVSVYQDDEEAFQIWKEEIGFPENKILRLGEKDNFWEMGETGPCGPSSEIYYDLGEEKDPNQKSPEEEGERFLELWNLVFMEFERKEDGSLVALPKKNIDTGMGLERLLTILQRVDSNFHTDLFIPIIEEIERISDVPYREDERGIAHRVIADHVRALTFSIADGVYPSNFGRGYVLRRILRRAHRFIQSIMKDEAILYRLVPVVVEIMKDAYPYLLKKKTEIELIVKNEEERFLSTLASNLPKLRESIELAERSGTLQGEEIFKLYDTYGIPLDLIEDMARERGVEIDREGFEREMEKQRRMARRKVMVEKITWKFLKKDYKSSSFVGYEKFETRTEIAKYRERKDGKMELVLTVTPFYGESGGQLGDRGTIIGENFHFNVIDTQKVGEDIVHIGTLEEGEVGSFEVHAKIDAHRRKALMRAHTATHLLHASLREIFGEHVRQEGSLVDTDRLRFDFTHYEPCNKEKLREVEKLVNLKIMENIPLRIDYKTYRDAIEEGAIALFVEKYEEKVRVVSISDFSRELCGGTHVKHTGEIGFFKIVGEEGVALGVRRIEALTGEKALEYVWRKEEQEEKISAFLKTDKERILERTRTIVESLEEENREKERILERYLDILSKELFAKKGKEKDASLYLFELKDLTQEALRRLADKIVEREKKNYIILLASSRRDKVFLFARVSKEKGRFVEAEELVRSAAKVVGGGGGGDSLKAEGGGRNPGKIKEALDVVRNLIKEKLN